MHEIKEEVSQLKNTLDQNQQHIDDFNSLSLDLKVGLERFNRFLKIIDKFVNIIKNLEKKQIAISKKNKNYYHQFKKSKYAKPIKAIVLPVLHHHQTVSFLNQVDYYLQKKQNETGL